jgi:hypothetical protein
MEHPLCSTSDGFVFLVNVFIVFHRLLMPLAKPFLPSLPLNLMLPRVLFLGVLALLKIPAKLNLHLPISLANVMAPLVL